MLSVALFATDNIIIKGAKKSDKNAMIFIFDNAGLNSYLSCPDLAKQNINKYNSLATKKAFRKQRIRAIEYYTFNEQIKSIGKIESNRYGKLFRKSKELIEKVELKKDNSKKAKDVLSIFHFLNMLVEERYKDYKNIVVVIFSNLRDSTLSKKQRLQLSPIKLNEKITLELFASSGLKCLGASTKQIISAEKSVIDYYNSKIDSKKLSIHTIY